MMLGQDTFSLALKNQQSSIQPPINSERVINILAPSNYPNSRRMSKSPEGPLIKQESVSSDDTVKLEDLQDAENDLYQKENQIQLVQRKTSSTQMTHLRLGSDPSENFYSKPVMSQTA